jgi:hypothetical protein
VRRVVQTAGKDAVEVLSAAVAEVNVLREKNRTSRDWDVVAARVTREAFEERLTGVMDAVLAELIELEQEHDLHPGNLEVSDPAFIKIDDLLAGKIGEPVGLEQLRSLVEEAINFRYPNHVPPGDRDSGKPTQIAAAGDYLLWWETLRRAAIEKAARKVLIVTGDTKPDWWEFDKSGKRVGPRPELVQEMRNETGKGLVLASLSDFLDGASEHLSAQVSPDTIEQVRTVEADAASIQVSAHSIIGDYADLLQLSPVELEHLVRSLLVAMGYSARPTTRASGDDGFDLVAWDERGLVPGKVAVEVKRYRSPIAKNHVLGLAGAMAEYGAPQGLIVTTGRFTESAGEVASRSSIRLIDGEELLDLLRNHLNLHFVVGRDDSADND